MKHVERFERGDPPSSARYPRGTSVVPPSRRRPTPNASAMALGRSSPTIVLTAIALLIAACGSTQPSSSVESASPGGSRSPAGTVATDESGTPPVPTLTLEPSPTSTTSAQASLAPDSIAVTTAEGLRVRVDPALSADQVSSLHIGTRVFVISGPATDPADARLEWWQVVPFACDGGCGYEPRIGWVSSGPQKDWLFVVEPACRDSFTSADTSADPETFSPVELLACHGSQPITLEGIIDYWCCRGITVGRTEPAWLAGDPVVARLRVSAAAGSGSWGPELHVDPDSGITLGERGTVARIVGHFDDPAAQACVTALSDDERERYPEMEWVTGVSLSVYQCRLQFVVDSVQVLDYVPLPTHPPQG
jgi:hypothetical protein